MAGGATVGRGSDDERRRRAVFQAADDIRAEGLEGVSLRSVWARVKRDHGVAGNNQSLGCQKALERDPGSACNWDPFASWVRRG